MTDAPNPSSAKTEPFERHPALASWIERLGHTAAGLSLGEWMTFIGALNAALVSERHPRPSLSVGLDREAKYGGETAAEIVQRWASWINDVSEDMDEPDWGGKTRNDVLNERDFILRSLLALAAPAEGYVLVPVEPTEAMVAAGYDAWLNTDLQGGVSITRSIWSAMIAACLPAAPTGETL